MILICPNCTSQFEVDRVLLGEKGRKVKCSACEKIWFEKVEPIEDDSAPAENIDRDEVEVIEIDVSADDVAEESEPSEEDAAESQETDDTQEDEASDEPDDDTGSDVEENENTEEFPHQTIPSSREDTAVPPRKNKALGIWLAASVFLIIFLYLLIFSTSIMHKYPSMQAFYALLGIHMEVPGKGLVFDQVNAEDDGKIITVHGRITNLTSEDKNVPVIEASLVDRAGTVLSHWYVHPSENVLEAEKTMAFETQHHKTKAGDHETNIRMRFVLTPKIDEGDDGNSPVLHQSGSDHQSDHGESSKSHQPASSDSHQEPSHQDHHFDHTGGQEDHSAGRH